MFRIIGRWLISRAIERERPPRGLLRRLIDRDEQLLRFEAASLWMVAQLRNDAGAWLNQEAGSALSTVRLPMVERGRRVSYRRRIVWAGAACALAASIVAMALLWPARSDQDTGAPAYVQQSEVKDGKKTLAPGDGERLIAAWYVGRAEVEAWHARAIDVPRKLDYLDWPIATKLSSAKWTGAATGRVRAALEAAAVTQRQEIADGMRSAITFFWRRLPASMAHLVGLQV